MCILIGPDQRMSHHKDMLDAGLGIWWALREAPAEALNQHSDQ